VTTIAPPAPPASPAPVVRLGPAAKHRSRAVRNGLATAFIVLSFVVVLVPLVLIIGYVIARGRDLFGLAFLTKDIPPSTVPGPGMGPAVYGTLLITGAATVMAVPLGVLGGVYLSEYGDRGLIARVLRFFAEIMTGVPSVVMGLFVYTAVVLHTQNLNAFAGALALACLMLPIVIRTTDEMLRLVPAELREGSVALGSRQARTIVRIVLPAAAPGIVSGALLAVARAAGETAPLIFVISTVYRTNRSLFNGGNTTLSVQIFNNASSPYLASQQRAWAAALTLIGIVFVFTVLARVITAFYSRRSTAS
jgi:phosphate transport system permease protein